MHDSRGAAAHGRGIGLSTSEQSDLQRLTRDHNWTEIDTRFGERFARDTGLPRGDIQDMARTSLLRDRGHRDAFRSTYRQMHGAEFNPRQRNNRNIAATAERLVRERPELRPVLEQLDGSHTSLGYYLGRGDTAENLNGWFARAAETELGPGRGAGLIQDVNPVTTEARHVGNFMHARSAVAQAGLTGEARTQMLGRISRQFHGAPGAARGHFFHDGDYSRPRAQSPEQMDQLLRSFLANDRRAQSDENFMRNYRNSAG